MVPFVDHLIFFPIFLYFFLFLFRLWLSSPRFFSLDFLDFPFPSPLPFLLSHIFKVFKRIKKKGHHRQLKVNFPTQESNPHRSPDVVISLSSFSTLCTKEKLTFSISSSPPPPPPPPLPLPSFPIKFLLLFSFLKSPTPHPSSSIQDSSLFSSSSSNYLSTHLFKGYSTFSFLPCFLLLFLLPVCCFSLFLMYFSLGLILSLPVIDCVVLSLFCFSLSIDDCLMLVVIYLLFVVV